MRATYCVLLLPLLSLSLKKESSCEYRCIKDGSCEMKIDSIYGGRELKFRFGQAYTWGSCANDHMGGGCTFVPPECQRCNAQPIRSQLKCADAGLVCNHEWACKPANLPMPETQLKEYHYDVDRTGAAYRVSNCICENDKGQMGSLTPRLRPWPGGPNLHQLTGERDGLRNPTCSSRGGTRVNQSSSQKCLGGIDQSEVAALYTTALSKSYPIAPVSSNCPDAGYCVRGSGSRKRCCKLIGLGNRRYGCPITC